MHAPCRLAAGLAIAHPICHVSAVFEPTCVSWCCGVAQGSSLQFHRDTGGRAQVQDEDSAVEGVASGRIRLPLQPDYHIVGVVSVQIRRHCQSVAKKGVLDFHPHNTLQTLKQVVRTSFYRLHCPAALDIRHIFATFFGLQQHKPALAAKQKVWRSVAADISCRRDSAGRDGRQTASVRVLDRDSTFQVAADAELHLEKAPAALGHLREKVSWNFDS